MGAADASRRSRVVVVVPTYEEAENIGGLLRALRSSPVDPDVLVVDDASPDGTADVVHHVAAQEPGRVHLLSRSGKEGLGPAYRAGFRWALERGDYDVVVQMDADGSHPTSALPALVAATGRADVALGSRYVRGGGTSGWPWHRELLSRGGNLYARLVLGLAQRDLTGGFKAWRADALAEMLGCGEPGATGYAFQIETTVSALRRGRTVVEVPFVFRERERGQSKMTSAIAREALGAVWSLRHPVSPPLAPAPAPLHRAGTGAADQGDPLVRQSFVVRLPAVLPPVVPAPRLGTDARPA